MSENQTKPQGIQPTIYMASLDPKSPNGIQVIQHFGRNEPCPCGSGIKFKKCCITNVYGDPKSQEEARKRVRQLVKMKKIQDDPHISGLIDLMKE